jgi:hypothetical protein
MISIRRFYEIRERNEAAPKGFYLDRYFVDEFKPIEDFLRRGLGGVQLPQHIDHAIACRECELHMARICLKNGRLAGLCIFSTTCHVRRQIKVKVKGLRREQLRVLLHDWL